MLNPCCCISPRIGTLIFGILDLILSAVFTGNVVRTIINSHVRDVSYTVWVDLALGIFGLFLAFLLIFGAMKRLSDKIRLWLLLMLAYIVCNIVFSILNVYHHTGPTHAFGAQDGGRVANILLLMYQLWVVWAYLHELQYGPAGLTYCPTQII